MALGGGAVRPVERHLLPHRTAEEVVDRDAEILGLDVDFTRAAGLITTAPVV